MPKDRTDTSRKGIFERTISTHRDWPRVLIEGDSWFGLPTYGNLADFLIQTHQYATLMLHEYGDTLENMLAQEEYIAPLKARKYKIWSALLFSAGGNDILGDPLPSLLKLNTGNLKPADLIEYDALKTQIQKLENLFIQLIRSVSRVNDKLPILVHGYDYAIPTGKGAKAFWITIAGPWMLPVMKAKKINDPSDQRAVIRILVDRFNEMLSGLHTDFPNFHHIDFRGMLNPGDWGDEIHPTSKSFQRLASKLDKELKKILKK